MIRCYKGKEMTTLKRVALRCGVLGCLLQVSSNVFAYDDVSGTIQVGSAKPKHYEHIRFKSKKGNHQYFQVGLLDCRDGSSRKNVPYKNIDFVEISSGGGSFYLKNGERFTCDKIIPKSVLGRNRGGTVDTYSVSKKLRIDFD